MPEKLTSLPSPSFGPHEDQPEQQIVLFLKHPIEKSQSAFFVWLCSLWKFGVRSIKFLAQSWDSPVAPLIVMTIGYFLLVSIKMISSQIDLTSSVSASLFSISSLSSPMMSLYCLTKRGAICSTKPDDPSAANTVSQMARSISRTADQASILFDSALQLNDSNNCELNPSAISDLGYSIRWSTELKDKQLLSERLIELADLTRDLKDELILLGDQGMNTFSLMAFKFTVVTNLVHWAHHGKKESFGETTKDIAILSNHLSTDLDHLYDAVQSMMTLASKSTNLVTKVYMKLYEEQNHFLSEGVQQGTWKSLLESIGFSGRPLMMEFRLTKGSMQPLRDTWSTLDHIWLYLFTYKNAITRFKVSLADSKVIDDGLLAPEDELSLVGSATEKFKLKVEQFKSNLRAPQLQPHFFLSFADLLSQCNQKEKHHH